MDLIRFQSSSFHSKLFENSLPSARFDAGTREIDTSWGSSMQPLFAPSQSQSVSSIDQDIVMRATQAPRWTPTLKMSSFEARKMFSQTPQDSLIGSRRESIKGPLGLRESPKHFAKLAEKKRNRIERVCSFTYAVRPRSYNAKQEVKRFLCIALFG